MRRRTPVPRRRARERQSRAEQNDQDQEEQAAENSQGPRERIGTDFHASYIALGPPSRQLPSSHRTANA
jgi:hypothetical protein